MTHERYQGIRSIMETPLLDERKWAKIPDIPADAIFVDLEDSLPPARKEEGRARMGEVLRDLGYFGGRVVLVRSNGLDTPWGHDDLVAIGRAGAETVVLPKLRGIADLEEARRILNDAGSDPDIFALIEAPQGVLEVDRIAAHEKVHALMFGPADLAMTSGIPLMDEHNEINFPIRTAKVRAVLAGAAHGLVTTDIAFLPDLRDLVEVRRRYQQSRNLGFTAGVTFYPPHVPIINEVFSPAPAAIEDARFVVGRYEAALAEGKAAVTLESGRTLLIQDYNMANAVLRRASAITATAEGATRA
jgi:citrate lyase beta subunit